MSSGTGAEDCSPASSRASAYSETAAGFQSYAGYLTNLERQPICYWPNFTETLWLASFNDDSQCIKWYRCHPWDGDTVSTPTNLSAGEENSIRYDTPLLLASDFQTLLQATNEDVAHRVLIVTAHHKRFAQVEDILGLGLDLEPEIFDFVKSCVNDPDWEGEIPMPWFRDCSALRIGDYVFCILEPTPERKSKTAIMFLNQRSPSYHLDDYGGDFIPILSKYSRGSTMFSHKTPSQILEISFPEINPLECHSFAPWLVRRFITEAIDSKNTFGLSTFLYICLASVLELHLSSAPKNEPYIGPYCLNSRVKNKYLGAYNEVTNERQTTDVNVERMWAQLRWELDEQRTTLRWMTRFFQKHFEYGNDNLRAAWEDIRERFKLRVQDLEQSEAQLKDHVTMQGISKSYDMAEMSIRESKRVMLLTALAFVFLPFSLASSVYGMNIQQINGTGHSIGAFVITAVVMCASAVVLWAALAGLQAHRASLAREHEEEHDQSTWPWYNKMVMFTPRQVLSIIWYMARDILVRTKRTEEKV